MRIIALTVLALVGCTQDGTNPSTANSSQLSPPEPTPQARLDGARPLHMHNCPSAIPGAATTSQPSTDGVDVTITARDPAARGEIVASALASAGRGDPRTLRIPEELHSGEHTGTGTHGACPIVHASTEITVEQIPSGVIVHERPYDAAKLPALRAAVTARVDALTPPATTMRPST
nr:hypothetical protein [Kofleriaceae bacterium]